LSLGHIKILQVLFHHEFFRAEHCTAPSDQNLRSVLKLIKGWLSRHALPAWSLHVLKNNGIFWMVEQARTAPKVSVLGNNGTIWMVEQARTAPMISFSIGHWWTQRIAVVTTSYLHLLCFLHCSGAVQDDRMECTKTGAFLVRLAACQGDHKKKRKHQKRTTFWIHLLPTALMSALQQSWFHFLLIIGGHTGLQWWPHVTSTCLTFHTVLEQFKITGWGVPKHVPFWYGWLLTRMTTKKKIPTFWIHLLLTALMSALQQETCKSIEWAMLRWRFFLVLDCRKVVLVWRCCAATVRDTWHLLLRCVNWCSRLTALFLSSSRIRKIFSSKCFLVPIVIYFRCCFLVWVLGF